MTCIFKYFLSATKTLDRTKDSFYKDDGIFYELVYSDYRCFELWLGFVGPVFYVNYESFVESLHYICQIFKENDTHIESKLKQIYKLLKEHT